MIHCFRIFVSLILIFNYINVFAGNGYSQNDNFVRNTVIVKVNPAKFDLFVKILQLSIQQKFTILSRFDYLSDEICQLKSKQSNENYSVFPDFDSYKIIKLDNVNGIINQGILDSALNSGFITGYYYPINPKNITPPLNIPDFVYNQKYLNEAPLGLSYKLLFGAGGYLGENVRFCDVEYGINSRHVEFEDASITLIKKNGFYPCPKFSDHGTAVMGILLAGDNKFGITGFAPMAQAYVSYLSRSADCSDIDYAGAIINGASYLSEGDVMALEIQTYIQEGKGSKLGPSEYTPDVFDAIKAVNGAGILVIEAGGNGGLNLDSIPKFRDSAGKSGAFIVSAAYPLSNQKMSFSPFGGRIDFFSHGANVFTCGYGDYYGSNDNNLSYTQAFDGTSAATALIAAATVSFQGVAKKILSRPLTSAELSDIFKSTGTSPEPPDSKIGIMPNLKKAYDYLLNLLQISYSKNNEYKDDFAVIDGYSGRNPIIFLKSDLQAKNIKIYDLRGNLINSVDLNNESIIEINRTPFAQGLYFFVIKTDNTLLKGRYLIN